MRLRALQLRTLFGLRWCDFAPVVCLRVAVVALHEHRLIAHCVAPGAVVTLFPFTHVGAVVEFGWATPLLLHLFIYVV